VEVWVKIQRRELALIVAHETFWVMMKEGYLSLRLNEALTQDVSTNICKK